MAMALELQGVVLDRRSSGGDFILEQPLLQIETGATVALLGPSGCGKSTLLDILALILRPTSIKALVVQDRTGRLLSLGSALARGSADELAFWRARLVGYVLQTGGLLPFARVRENILLPRQVIGLKGEGPLENLARRLEIADLLSRWPDELSVGQRQRVAVARALCHLPPLIIADEPTSSLDPSLGDITLSLLIEACRETEATLIVSTHDHDRARRFSLQPLLFAPCEGRAAFQFAEEGAGS